jgi:acyl carrier protein
MMERTQTFEKVLHIVKPFCKNEEAVKNVNENSRFLEDLNVNSARLVDIVLAMEDEFNIEVDDESADGIRTMGDAVNLILKKMN